MKKTLAILLALVMTLSLVACGSKTEAPAADPAPAQAAPEAAEPAATEAEYPEIVLQCGFTTTAVSGYCQGIQAFSDKLSELTGGKMSVQLFPDAQLGDEVSLLESVSTGTVNMCVTSSSPVANYVQEFYTFDMPFLITDLDHAHEVFDGELGRGLLDKLSDIGIYGLALWDNGFRNLTNSKMPVYAVADVSGMKIRVMENAIHQALWEDLGAYPTPMAFGEVITALQQGTIDGQENPLNAIYSSGVYEVQKYISLTHHVFTAGVVSINQELYNSWNDATKAAFDEAMLYATQFERDYVAGQEEEMSTKLVELGCEINEVNDIQEWVDAVSGIYDEYADKIDTELLKALQG